MRITQDLSTKNWFLERTTALKLLDRAAYIYGERFVLKIDEKGFRSTDGLIIIEGITATAATVINGDGTFCAARNAKYLRLRDDRATF